LHIHIRILKQVLQNTYQSSILGFDELIDRSTNHNRGIELLRARARITSPVWVLRHLSGKARGLRILLYGKDEQRRQTGWIDAQTGEVILARALSKRASYAGNVGPSGFPGGRMPLHKNRSGVLNI